MEILNKAKNIASKYGISFYRFGPFLSYVNKKIGFCLKLNTKEFGYLTRNFTFNNLEEFEKFIKNYSYYKNKLNCKSDIKFDNYLSENPKVIYGFDEEKLIEKENEEAEKTLIINNLKRFKLYLDDLHENRLNEIIKRSNIKIELDAKLNEYKKNLHLYYGKNYIESSNMLDNTFQMYQDKYKKNISMLDNYLQKLTSSSDLKETKSIAKNLLNKVKKIEEDEAYFGLVFDTYLFKNKIAVVERMNEFIIKMLNSENKISYQELKMELDVLKNSIPFNNTKDKFISESVLEIEEKYKGIDVIEEYNYFNFINKLKLEKYEKKQIIIKLDSDNKGILKEQFETLTEEQKTCLYLLFSPFRKIIEYIINGAVNNTLETADFKEYYDFYLETCENVEKVDNAVFSKKYFDKIDFSSYQQFINSLIDVAEIIYGIRMHIKEKQDVWAHFNDNDFIVCYEKTIKNNNVIKISLQENSVVLYSGKEIKYKNDDSSILEMLDSNEIILLRHPNRLEKTNEIIEVIEYKYITEEQDGSLIVTKVEPDKLFKYDVYNCSPKE